MSDLVLEPEPLTSAAFAGFGDVVELDPSRIRMINGGTTERHHALARMEAKGEGAGVILSIFLGSARAFPYAVDMVERHPLGSQSFQPLEGRPWLVVVAPDEGGRPGRPRLFRARGDQGINYRANVWHHPLMALAAPSRFLVADRDGPGNNLEEFFYPQPFIIKEP